MNGINQDFKMVKSLIAYSIYIFSVKCCSESIYKTCEKKTKGMESFRNTNNSKETIQDTNSH